jgi:7-carboxy-7-deazaguanine synthase
LDTTLRITEIFLSLQGESRSMGWPTVFVRLTGCPLRCVYCDTTYAFSGGTIRSLANIMETVRGYGVRHVCVTGGEPLAQQGCITLLQALVDEGYDVSLETSGAMGVAAVDPHVSKIMDLKTPSSGEAQRNRYENLAHLTAHDQIKFVIMNDEDYRWSVEQLRQHRLPERCEILFSPAIGSQNPTELAEKIIADRLPVRFQLQLHKILWGDTPGR